MLMSWVFALAAKMHGSGSTRPEGKSAPESTRPGSTRPESTRPSVLSERSVTYIVYGLSCNINIAIKLLIDRIMGEPVIRLKLMAVLNLRKVFTLFQALTPITCKQGNYRFLTIELVIGRNNTKAWIKYYW